MKNLILPFAIIFFYLTTSCDDNRTEPCYPSKPIEAELTIHLTAPNEYDTIPFMVFRGRVEEKDTILIDTAYTETHYFWFETGQYYSTQATYTVAGKEVIVTDGKKLRTVNNSDDSGDCWNTIGEDHFCQLIYSVDID